MKRAFAIGLRGVEAERPERCRAGNGRQDEKSAIAEYQAELGTEIRAAPGFGRSRFAGDGRAELESLLDARAEPAILL